MCDMDAVMELGSHHKNRIVFATCVRKLIKAYAVEEVPKALPLQLVTDISKRCYLSNYYFMSLGVRVCSLCFILYCLCFG